MMSVCRQGVREGPATVKNFLSRLVKPDRIVPPRGNRDAVDPSVFAGPEMDRERAILVRRRRGVVVAVAVQVIGREEALGIVDGYRPEGVDGHVTDLEHIGRLAIVLLNAGEDIGGRCPRQAAPIAIALNRMDAGVLISAFGREPKAEPSQVLASLKRVWVSTLYHKALDYRR